MSGIYDRVANGSKIWELTRTDGRVTGVIHLPCGEGTGTTRPFTASAIERWKRQHVCPDLDG